MRTVEQNRALFLLKANLVSDQNHFDSIMALFPVELRQEIYDQVQPLLKAPLILTPGLLVCPDEIVPASDVPVTSGVAAVTDEDKGKRNLITADHEKP